MRPGFDEYAKFTEERLISGVEIGVRYGRNAIQLLEGMPNIKILHLVDSYATEDNDTNLPFEVAKKTLAPFKDKTEWYIMTSEEAVKNFPDNSLDFVYIDGNHTYGGCKHDITAWYPKVKEDGLIAGHDFDTRYFPGVAKAITEFACENKKALNTTVHYTLSKLTPIQCGFWFYKNSVAQ